MGMVGCQFTAWWCHEYSTRWSTIGLTCWLLYANTESMLTRPTSDSICRTNRKQKQMNATSTDSKWIARMKKKIDKDSLVLCMKLCHVGVLKQLCHYRSGFDWVYENIACRWLSYLFLLKLPVPPVIHRIRFASMFNCFCAIACFNCSTNTACMWCVWSVCLCMWRYRFMRPSW